MSNVSVPVLRDKIVEGTEKFELLLNVPSLLGPAIMAGSRNTAVGIINDSTSKNFIKTFRYTLVHINTNGSDKRTKVACTYVFKHGGYGGYQCNSIIDTKNMVSQFLHLHNTLASLQ